MGVGDKPYELRSALLAAGVLAAWCQCTCGSGGGSIDGVSLCVSPNVALTVLLAYPRSHRGERGCRCRCRCLAAAPLFLHALHIAHASALTTLPHRHDLLLNLAGGRCVPRRPSITLRGED